MIPFLSIKLCFQCESIKLCFYIHLPVSLLFLNSLSNNQSASSSCILYSSARFPLGPALNQPPIVRESNYPRTRLLSQIVVSTSHLITTADNWSLRCYQFALGFNGMKLLTYSFRRWFSQRVSLFLTRPMITHRRLQCLTFPVTVLKFCIVMLESSVTVMFILVTSSVLALHPYYRPQPCVFLLTIPCYHSHIRTGHSLYARSSSLNTSTHANYDCGKSRDSFFLMPLCKGRPNRWVN
jgi:hypothetical protein